jgi:hypothetical protein
MWLLDTPHNIVHDHQHETYFIVSIVVTADVSYETVVDLGSKSFKL